MGCVRQRLAQPAVEADTVAGMCLAVPGADLLLVDNIHLNARARMYNRVMQMRSEQVWHKER